jgi:tetratricopeptide (TPR) repeat protein
MRFDKWTVVIGAATVAVTTVLGALAGLRTGVLAGVLTALAGAAFATGWPIAANRWSKIRDKREQVRQAERKLAQPRPLTCSPAGYLRPEAEIVSFRDRPQLGALRDWLVSPDLTGVRLVTGQAGSGKTRLALQLAAEAEQYGWRCYWVPSGGDHEAADIARTGGFPALLLVDYAETRSGLAEMIAQVTAEDSGPATRVLLLARSAGEWWQQLITESDARASDALAAVVPMALGPLTGPAGQEGVFQQAIVAFASELETDCPSAKVPALGASSVVLVVHAAALLAVLDRKSRAADGTADPAAGADDVIARLLGHEARYWEHTQARYQLNLSPAIRERAVAVGTLIGADDEASATRLLAAIDDLADPGVRGKTARWLHDLYPASEPAAAHADGIGALRPDLVAEHLIVKVLASQPGLTSAIFGGLAEIRATSALTTLARAALADPAAADLIEVAICSHPDSVVVPAMTVAVETNPSVGDQIASALAAQLWHPELLARIAKALPGASLALAQTAAFTYERLADASENDIEQKARNLLNLSNWMSRLGRLEDALAAIEEAVTAYRQLAAARPDAFLPDLAGSLTNQSVFLSDVGRREDALAAIEQSVKLRRQLAAARPDAFLPDLAMSLSNQSLRLADMGRREDALAAIEQAVTIRRDLAAARPDAFLPDLATSLNNQSSCLSGLGRREDALAAIEQSVTIRRELAAALPAVFMAGLKSSLMLMADVFAAVGKEHEADAARAEASRLD